MTVHTMPRRDLRVGLLGAGALGGTLADLLARGAVAGCIAGGVLTRSRGVPDDLLDADVVVESAGVGPALERVPDLLAAGCDVVLCSCGALAEPALLEALALLPDGAGSLRLPSGAIGGLDVFRAAVRGSRTATATLHTTKRPAALEVDVDRPTVVFTGTAREAARRFPRTSNVAVTLALATTGLDHTTVTVTADPAAGRTRHVLTLETDLGQHRVEVENAVAGGSGGRTSAVTAWSVVTLLEDLATGRPGGLLITPGRAGPGARPPADHPPRPAVTRT